MTLFSLATTIPTDSKRFSSKFVVHVVFSDPVAFSPRCNQNFFMGTTFSFTTWFLFSSGKSLTLKIGKLFHRFQFYLVYYLKTKLFSSDITERNSDGVGLRLTSIIVRTLLRVLSKNSSGSMNLLIHLVTISSSPEKIVFWRFPKYTFDIPALL